MITKTQNNKALMGTILFIAFIQMAHLAILPGINLIAMEIFPTRSLQEIQTVMALPNIIALITGVAASMLVRYDLMSKKTMVLAGLILVTFTGVSAMTFNTKFWHLYLMNTFLGAGMGIYFPSIQSIMFDNFDEKKRGLISGLQSAFSNGGAIVMSIIAGFLISFAWYGGHLLTLLALPVIILSLFVIPKDEMKRSSGVHSNARTKIPGDVYYYAVLIFMFMIAFNVAGMNISTHITNGNIGNAATAGSATALMMGGGVIAGLFFPKISKIMKDSILTLSFIMLFIGFLLMSLFPYSLIMTFAAMTICGAALSLYMPQCVFNVSNITDPTNSATATMLIVCIAPGGGSFLSPVIMTNLTILLGGNSTGFRYQFTAWFCLMLAVLTFFKSYRDRDVKRITS